MLSTKKQDEDKKDTLDVSEFFEKGENNKKSSLKPKKPTDKKVKRESDRENS